MQYLSILERNVYSSELLRSGWLDESAVVSDTELEALYNDPLREQMRGSSPVPSWSDDEEDTERTIPLEEEEDRDRSERWGQLDPIVILDSPASPSTQPPSQLRRSGTADISMLAEAATVASLATRSFAPEAAEALQALADAARRIGNTAAGSRLAVATTAAAPDASGDGAAASGAAAASGEAAARRFEWSIGGVCGGIVLYR